MQAAVKGVVAQDWEEEVGQKGRILVLCKIQHRLVLVV
jgi:hypothetical protein